MKNKIVPVLLLVLACWVGNARVGAQVLLYQESFETDGEGTRYTSNAYDFCPTDPDYFFRTNTNPPIPTGCSVGFGSAVTGIPNGTFFWAGEDIMSNQAVFPGAHAPGDVTTRNITITNYTSLQFKFWLATGSNAARWENSDSINVQASIDAGPFRTVGRFMGSAVANGNLIRDLNLNGIADPAELTPICDVANFTQYTFSIPGSGSTLRVRLDFDQYGGTEESAFDLMEVYGTLVVCTPPSASCPATQTLTLNSSCQATLPDYRSLTTAVGGTCGPMTIVQASPAIGSTQTGAGALTVTMYAQNTALQGSTNTCTFQVNKVSTPPTITCPGTQTLALNSSCQATLPDYSSLASGITGSCNPAVTQSPAIGSIQSGAGPLTVSLFATNSVPQSATCTFVVNKTTPEIAVTGNSVLIPDGDVLPSLGDFTDFGSVSLPGNVVRTYTITNSGNGNLTLAPGSITTTGTDAAMFVVGGITLPLTITPGLSATFTVTFTPSSGGLKVARVNIANNDCDENPYDYSIQGTGVALPEINITGNAVSIVDGDVTPSLTDHTDFGSQSICSGTIVRTFTIENQAGAPLTFTAPVISGTNAADFTLTLAPTSPVNAGNSTTFQITFNPSASGLRSATITLTNNDADEGTYDFAIQGLGTDPEINLQGNSVSIVDGDATPSLTDFTDFGNVNIPGNLVRTYTIQNTGNANLTIGGGAITVTGANAGDFVVGGITLPAAVAAAGSTTFTVTFTPAAVGLRTATINIANNDCDEATYDFAVQGTGVQNGAALFFDGGNDFVRVPDNALTDFGAGDFTVECWSKKMGPSNVSDNSGIVGKWNTGSVSGSNEWLLTNTFNGNDDLPAFLIEIGSTTYSAVGSTPLVYGTWYHLAGVRRGNTINLFVNGVLAQTTVIPAGTINNVGRDVLLASLRQATGPSIFSNIQMDELRIWNRGLCQAEIANNMNCEIPTTGTNLVANYHFNQGVASQNNAGVTSLTDVGGNNLNGTLTNFNLNGATSNWIAPGGVLSGTSCTAFNQAEINVQGNALSIVDGDITPTTADHTDFGSVLACSGTITRTFTIQNPGTSNLTVSTIVLSGTNPTNYAVTGISLPATITAAGSTTFQVTFDPSATGLRTATLTLNNNDCDEAVYDFAIQGTGNADIVNPTIVCPANTSASAGASQCSATVTFVSPTGVDNCPSPTTTQTAGIASGGTFPVGVTTNVFRVTDGSGNTATCSFTVTVTDNTLPTITCPANVSVSNTALACGALVSYSTPVGTDNCPAPVTTRTAGLASGSAFPVGLTTNTFRVTDAAGNTATCSFTVTVTDNEPPVLRTLACNSSNASATDYDDGWQSNDNGGAGFGPWTLTSSTGNVSQAGFFVGNSTANGAGTDTNADGDVNSSGRALGMYANSSQGVDGTRAILGSFTIGSSVKAELDNGFVDSGQLVGFQLQNASGQSLGEVRFRGGQPTYELIDVNGITPFGSVPFTDEGVVIEATSMASGVASMKVTRKVNGATQTLPMILFPQGGGQVIAKIKFFVSNAGSGAPKDVYINNMVACLATPGCPANQSVAAALSTCAANVSYVTPVAGDNCANGPVTQTSGLASGASFPVGITTNAFLVTDASSNTATCSFTVTVSDNQLPTITCPANQSLNASVGQCGAIVTYVAPVGADNCPSPVTTQTAGIASGGSFPVGVTTNTFRVTDASSNTATCSFTVTVVDNQLPAINCPLNLMVSAGAGVCSAAVSYSAPVGTDNCPSPTTTQLAGLASGATFPIGVTTNTFRVTDAAGNTATCSFTINVIDLELPTITCPANQSVNAGVGQCSATATFVAPVGLDNCPSQVTTQIAGLASGASYPVGVTTNTFRVTDASTNSATCSFTVTVVDNQLPTITCPANQSVNAGLGQCNATVTFTAPTGSDNCPSPVTVQTAGLASGASFPVGVTTNTFRVTDAASNTATCSFTVTVVDNQLPTITCPANQSVNATVSQCSASVTYSTPSGADNCPSPVTTQTAGLASGASFSVGVTTNTFRVTDAAGNTATCSFTVTVVDNQVPTITCPANLSVNTGVGQCSATVTFTAPVGTDNCPSPVTVQTAGLASGATFPIGVTTNTFRVTDAASNTATCSFTVTVVDNQLPTISCPANQSVNASVGVCSATVTYTAPVGSDNCPSAVTTQTAGLISGVSYPVGVTTNTFRVTDAAGNTTTCSFTVTVVDNQLPTITCPANISVNASPSQCSATVTYTAPTGSDNCPSPVTIRTAGLASGASFPVGVTTNTFRVTDAASNTASCSFTVTVVDNQLPTITCPANQSVNATVSQCSATVTYSTPSGADNCPSPVTTQTAGLASGASFSVGVTTNTFRVTDAAGNTATCSFTVTVVDNQLPAITCPANISVNASPGLCTAVVTYAAPTGTDNCPSPTTALTTGLASGASFPSGVTNNTFRVTDASGNTATCSFTVTVVDNQLPTISCPGNITGSNDLNQCSKLVTYTAPTGTDNCAGATTTQIAGLPSGANFPVGTTTNTFRVTDGSGNSTTCSFTVVITDTQLPSISCPSNQSVNASVGQCTATVSYTAPVGTDNCPSPSTAQILGQASGTSFPAGTTINRFVVTDASGNTSSCSFNVVVIDNQVPTIACPANIVGTNDPGLCSMVVTYSTPAGADNCPGAGTIRTTGLASGSAFPVGTTTTTYRVTDASGNTASCAFTTTITDTELPTITCPANINSTNDANLCSRVVTYAAPVGADNCPSATTIRIAGLSSGSAFAVGTTTTTYRVTDASGNTATCSFTVVITDAQAPVINCPANITGTNDLNQCSKVVSFTTPVGTDNCPGQSTIRTVGLASGSAFPVGTTTNAYQVTDAAGNTTTCSFTLVISDNQLPVVSCPANITGNNDPNLCSKVVSYTTPIGTDNCPGQVTVRTTGLASGAVFPVGTTTNTFTVTDAAGNSASCAFTVVISDNQLPTISCPGNIVGVNDLNQCSKVVTYSAPVGSDNCAGQTTAQITGLASGAAFPIGTTTNTFRVTDAAGNSVTCSFTVVITDAQLPEIICPANISGNNDPGQCSKVVTFSPLVGTDNCPSASTVQTAGLTSGATYPVGTTVNAYRVTDASGNSATCSFTVQVTDNEAPVLTCPPSQVVNADSSICGAIINWAAPTPTDNCGMNSLVSNQVPGAVFVIGSSFVTYYASDIHGNSSSCSFGVTVNGVPLHVQASSPLLGCGYHVACAGDSTAAVSTYTSGGCLPYNYVWSNGSTSNNLQNMGAGVYIVTVTDGQQETWVDTVTITAPNPLVLMLTGDTLVCELDSSGVLGTVVTGGQDCAPYSYLWNTGSTANSLAGLPAGNYSVVVTDTMGCNVTDGRVLQLGINPILNLGPDTTKCPGTTLAFEAPSIYSAYLWDNGTQNSTVFMSTPGDYICTVWTAQGCQDNDTVRVEDHIVDYNIITALGALQLCDGDTLTLESDSGLTNLVWSTGETTASIGVAAFTGLVTLQALDVHGCATADTVAVSYTPILLAPVITPGPNAVLCVGSTLQLDLQAGYFGYLWSNGQTTQSIVIAAPGVYQATVSNGFGCTRASDPTTVVLGQLPTPTVTVGVNSLSTSPFAGYQWMLAGNPILGAITISHQPIVAGWYSVMVTDSNGCMGTSDSVYFNPVGVIDQVVDIQGLSIYPNPSRGTLNLHTLNPIDWPMTVEVWDMFGQKVKSFEMAHLMDVVAFDLQDLSSAPYLLKITTYRRNTTEQAVFRFVKE